MPDKNVTLEMKYFELNTEPAIGTLATIKEGEQVLKQFLNFYPTKMKPFDTLHHNEGFYLSHIEDFEFDNLFTAIHMYRTNRSYHELTSEEEASLDNLY